MQNRYQIKTIIFFCICTALIFSSCKKEYLQSPYKDIESFVIKDALNNNISAALIGDSIIVYWPPFQNVPAKQKPEITLSANASISPVSGQEIDFKTGVTYTVTAQDGSTRKYTLKLAENIPSPFFDVNSIAYLRFGDNINLAGGYIIPDTVQTRLFLVDANKKSHPISIVTVKQNHVNALLPIDKAALDTGKYQVKLVSGKHTVVNGPYYIGKPGAAKTNGIYQFNQEKNSIKKGEQISFTYSLQQPAAAFYYGTYTHAIIRITGDTGGKTHTAPIASQTNTLLTFTLPSTISTGAIRDIVLYAEGDVSTPTGNLMYRWKPTSATTTTIVP